MFLTIELCFLGLTELFEIELFICIKMNLSLNNLQRLICHKNQPTIIRLHTVKWYHVLLSNTNDFKFYYEALTIQLNTTHLFTLS